jgi:hypothetical protein
VEPMVASSQHLAYNMVILTTVMWWYQCPLILVKHRVCIGQDGLAAVRMVEL